MNIGPTVRTIFVMAALLALACLPACGQEPADPSPSTGETVDQTETPRSGRIIETPTIVAVPEESPVQKDNRISGPVSAASIPFPTPVPQTTRVPTTPGPRPALPQATQTTAPTLLPTITATQQSVSDLLRSARAAIEVHWTYAFSVEGEVSGQTAGGDTIWIPISYAGESLIGYNSAILTIGEPRDTTALRTASVHHHMALGYDLLPQDTDLIFDAEKQSWSRTGELIALSALINHNFLFGEDHATESFAARSDMKMLPAQTLNGDEALVMSGQISIGSPDDQRTMEVTYWVTENDGIIRKLTASGPFDPAMLSIRPENIPYLSNPQVEMSATFSDYGKIIDYRSPVISFQRFSHDAVPLDDGRVLIYGGFSGALSDSFNPGFPMFFSEIYDPGDKTWTFVERIWEVSPEDIMSGAIELNLFMFSHGVVLDNGSIAAPAVALEGTGGNAAIATLNDEKTSWTKMSDMPNPRTSASAALLGDGRILVTGGANAAMGLGLSEAPTAIAEVYDPQTNTWQSLASMNVATFNHVHVSLEDGRVLAIGGTLDDFINGPGTARVEIYDPQADTWELAAEMNVPRARPRAIDLPDGRILVAGTSQSPYGNPQISLSSEAFDPGTGTWTLTSPMTEPRTNHTLTLLPDGTVLVAGGNDPRETMHVPLATTEIFDPATNTWTAGPYLAHARSEHTATLMPDGTVLFIGGVMQQESDDVLASVETLTP
ncbi:MAG: hypothetical protein F4Y49_09420 [Dehalococcoidia bacterium]|nr:hypothetical protein [Dehalococcoidia bacterium]